MKLLIQILFIAVSSMAIAVGMAAAVIFTGLSIGWYYGMEAIDHIIKE